jgi:hypothetical protein
MSFDTSSQREPEDTYWNKFYTLNECEKEDLQELLNSLIKEYNPREWNVRTNNKYRLLISSLMLIKNVCLRD